MPKKVDTFSESSCRLLLFPPGVKTPLWGEHLTFLTPDRYFLSQQPLTFLRRKKILGKEERRNARESSESGRRLRALALRHTAVFLCREPSFHFSLLPASVSVSGATTFFLLPACLLTPPLLRSLLLLPLFFFFLNPYSIPGKALPA